MSKRRITITIDCDLLEQFDRYCDLWGVTRREAYSEFMIASLEKWKEFRFKQMPKLLDIHSMDKRKRFSKTKGVNCNGGSSNTKAGKTSS